jgi:hypothetical protein
MTSDFVEYLKFIAMLAVMLLVLYLAYRFIKFLRKYYSFESSMIENYDRMEKKRQFFEELKEKNVQKEFEKFEINENDNKNIGGYIIIDLPSNLKSTFHDFLKGFEEFAKLKGYHIYFSFDNSESDKIGFKFTIADNINNISENEVRDDIQEYIERLNNGEDFADLPYVINPIEHSLIYTALKGRISLLKHNLNLEKNARTLYEGMLRSLSESLSKYEQQPILINNGEINAPGSIIESNTKDVIQGES